MKELRLKIVYFLNSWTDVYKRQGLLDLKDLRLSNITTVKLLGSKGRNLRSANHIITRR